MNRRPSTAPEPATKPLKLEAAVQLGLLVIIALMPFHAFFSVWLGSLTGHMAVIQSWKEVLLVLLGLATAILAIRQPTRLDRLRQPWAIAGLSLIVLGILVTLAARPGLTTAAFGLKTDLEFVVAALIALLVASKLFIERAIKAILISAAVVTGYDLLQIFVLPADFLTHFGYGPNTILPYQHITEGTAALRFPATLGGPNQLGTYLILPLCLSLALFMRHRQWWLLALFGSSLVSLIFTFSRSAWVGAALAIIITGIACLPRRARRPAVLGTVVLAAIALACLPLAIRHDSPLQYFILHASVQNHDDANRSDSLHAESLTDGLAAVTQQPLGHGLGTAGPATFHAGATNIIENYYLQIGYEMGIIAIIIFGILIVLITLMLIHSAHRTPLAIPLAASFIGISVVALVLPAWVDSTTALITWICAGAVAGLGQRGDYV